MVPSPMFHHLINFFPPCCFLPKNDYRLVMQWDSKDASTSGNRGDGIKDTKEGVPACEFKELSLAKKIW